MDKPTLAAYLVSLNDLMQAQEATARPKSQWLITEYTNAWDQFQALVEEERRQQDEARKS